MDILIVDDHALFSDGLGNLLCDVFDDAHVETLTSGSRALECLNGEHAYDLVLLDLRLSDMSGISVLESLRDSDVSTPVVIISASSNAVDIRQAMDAGALGFIHKSVDRNELKMAVEQVLAGNLYTSKSAEETSRQGHTPFTLPDGGHLTRRQHDVLTLLAEGLLNKQIAERLGTSEHTIKIHVSAVMKKLGVRNRTTCVNEAVRLGLLPPT
ncbi:MAG: DNA-binding response regulator [marine bacterium B5-7]|nr:MAG: DNA-binding response regulator [marine bacterium B5-7]